MIPSSRTAPPRPSAVPASQNTAPVAEFRCLFTHDVRRKQKRWQDGFLKFHTFNNRVMVYDDSRNFLGDTYYKDSDQLVEGDELRLDKGVMVQVEEAMGITQTDLTPLFEKRTAESPARPTPSVQTKPFQRPTSVLPNSLPRPNSQLRHRSLNTLLGGSRTPIGKAVPMQSPYEVRQEKENGRVEERAPKRPRLIGQPPCAAAAKPLREMSIPGVQPVRIVEDPVSARKGHAPVPPEAQPSPVIDLDSETEVDETAFSDVTVPNHSPEKDKSLPPPAIKPMAKKPIARPKPPALAEPVAVANPVVPKAKLTQKLKPRPRKTIIRAAETPQKHAPPSSPPVSASDRIKNIDFAMSARKEVPQAPSPALVPPQSPKMNPKMKSLRLSVGVKRGTLLCQTTAKQPKKVENTLGTKEKKRKSNEGAVLRIATDHETTLVKKDVMHAKSAISRQTHSSKNDGGFTQLVSGSAFEDEVMLSPFDAPFDTLEDPEIVLGTMVQQVMSIPSPHRISTVQSEVNELRGSTSRRKKAKVVSVANADPKSLHDIQARAPKSIAPPQSVSREASPGTDTGASTTSRQSRADTTKTAPSAGGFKKKVKRVQKKAEVQESAPVQKEAQSFVEETPEPPDRALNKRHIDTNVAQSQQKSKRLKPTTPAESAASLSSPNRSFRRVRSENDAPIPSRADDWEKRNAPNLSKSDDAPTPTTNMLHPPFKKNSGLAALTRKTDPRKKFLRTQSLSLDTAAAAKTVVAPAMQVELKSPVVDTDVGPWSTEAFDLFDWRPPGHD